MSTWGDKLQKMSREALNRLATAEFAKEKVFGHCAERASQGFGWAEIRPSIAVNIQECEAVQQLLANLEREKVRHEWVPVIEVADTKYFALRISWEKRR